MSYDEQEANGHQEFEQEGQQGYSEVDQVPETETPVMMEQNGLPEQSETDHVSGCHFLIQCDYVIQLFPVFANSPRKQALSGTLHLRSLQASIFNRIRILKINGQIISPLFLPVRLRN